MRLTSNSLYKEFQQFRGVAYVGKTHIMPYSQCCKNSLKLVVAVVY